MTTAPPRKNRLWFWLIFIIGLIILAGLWYSSSQNPAPAVQPVDATPSTLIAEDTVGKVKDRLG